jgi:hypothetical protein
VAYQVSDKTKKQSTKCPYMFQCLNNETWDTCSIERDIQGAFLAIKTKKDKASALTLFLMVIHFFAIVLPDVKSINGTIYNLSFNLILILSASF